MKTWIVEKPPLPPTTWNQFETITAEFIEFDNGTLKFYDGSYLIAAFSASGYLSVRESK